MSQILSQLPQQRLEQQMRLTPQLIQAMDILQLNALALESRITQELDSNPALELTPDEDETPRRPDAADPASQALGENAADFQRLDSLVREYDWIEDEEYRGTRSRAALAEESDQKLDAMANTAARGASLQEIALEQWAMLELDAESRRLGVAIIEALASNGRLETPLAEIAAQLQPPATITALEDALARVQQLDPPGVAARDLQECLLLQLEAQPGPTDVPRRIIEDHFEDLQKNRLPQIARALGVELSEVKAAVAEIARLSMHPGLEEVSEPAATVMPDVLVEYQEESDRYEVRLSRGNLRELRISTEFREALERAKGDKSTRDFVRQKLDAAGAIIDAVRFRRERLLEVAKAVVEAQRDFLDRGEQHMRVLRMSDLAERFDCDPSTISRTVDQKWMQTPRGIYPLRRFFTGGIESEDGEILGWDSIKAKVQQIVDQEDKSSPLSDDEIVDKLKSEGIEIKRRTVAKYRAQLEIPTARQRRKY